MCTQQLAVVCGFLPGGGGLGSRIQTPGFTTGALPTEVSPGRPHQCFPFSKVILLSEQNLQNYKRRRIYFYIRVV